MSCSISAMRSASWLKVSEQEMLSTMIISEIFRREESQSAGTFHNEDKVSHFSDDLKVWIV